MSKKQKILSKTNGKCAYCGACLEITGTHIDHMTPKSRGGCNSIENLVPSCPSCNTSKGTKTFEEFRVYIGINKSVPHKYRFSMAQCAYLKDTGAYKSIPDATVNHVFYIEGL